MAEFLTTHRTASQLEDLIIEARQELVLISPYLQLSDLLFTRLKEADSRFYYFFAEGVFENLGVKMNS